MVLSQFTVGEELGVMVGDSLLQKPRHIVGQFLATFLFLQALSCEVSPLDANSSQEKFGSPLKLNIPASSTQLSVGESEMLGVVLGAGVGQKSLLQTPGQLSKISEKVKHLADSSTSSNWAISKQNISFPLMMKPSKLFVQVVGLREGLPEGRLEGEEDGMKLGKALGGPLG